MKYYTLKYKDDLNGWGGKASLFRIEILKKYKDDEGLLEHEKFHVRCWIYCTLLTWLISLCMYWLGTGAWWVPAVILGPYLHTVLYRNKYFRRMVEARAYQIQLKEGNYVSDEFAIKAMMNKYGFGMSRGEAKKALKL